ncbi:Pterin-4-alpha-carbinolamine dehydratase 2, mitochondrial [Ancistrocladus abbreviatus]
MIPFTARFLTLSKSSVQLSPLFGSLLSDSNNGSSTIWVTEILQKRVEVSKSRKSLHGFRTFCTATDLSAKKCVPCNSKDMRPMSDETANELIIKVPGWNLAKEGGKLKLTRSWKVKSFTKGLEFFGAIADVAEAEGHHPDLHLVGWNNLTVEIRTHAVGGLTENDFILAAKINGLDLAHLLRRKAAG